MANVVRDDQLVQIEAPAISLRGSDGTEYARIEAGVGSGLLGGSLPAFSTFSIKSYGAKVDGSTDDITAINAATLAAKNAGGGNVVFPIGVTVISAAIKLYDGVHLVGVAGDLHDTTKGSVIQAAAAGTFAATAMVDANDTRFAGVHRIVFTVPGADATNNTTQGITDFSDSTKQATYLVVEDCTFQYLGGTLVGLYGNVNWIIRNSVKTCNGRFVHLLGSGSGPGAGSDNIVAFNDAGPLGAVSLATCSTGSGIRVEGANNGIFQNHLYGFQHGIHVYNGNYNRLEGNRCEKNALDGIRVESTGASSGHGNTVSGNHCFNNGWSSSACGVNLTGSGVVENQVVGNYLFNNTSTEGSTNQLYGVLIQSSALGNQIVANHIFNVVNHGIDVRGSTVNAIRDNFVSTCGQHGIHLTTGANSNAAEGNTIYKCGQTTDATYDGIRVESGSDDNFIHGNHVARSGTNQQKYGINISSSDCDRTIVTGNNCSSGGKTAAINDAGTSSRVVGNTRSTGPLNGRAVLVAGTVTVSTAEVLSGDNIVLTRVVAGGTAGNLSVGTITAATSFVINSDNSSDTSTIYWEIRH